jgi:hypothetical protein
LALLPGRCATIASVIAFALPGSAAMGTTGLPQSVPAAQSEVLFGP